MGEKLLLSSRQLIQIKLVPVPKSFPAKSHDWNNKAICQKRQIENYRRNPENIFDLNWFDLINCVVKNQTTYHHIWFKYQINASVDQIGEKSLGLVLFWPIKE